MLDLLIVIIVLAVWLVAKSLRAGAKASEGIVGVERAPDEERAAWAAEYAGLELPYSALLATHSPAMRAVTSGQGGDQSP